MNGLDFLFRNHIVAALAPVADAFATAMTTDFVTPRDYSGVGFLIQTGVATGGTANGVVTLLASAVAAGTNTTAIPFRYRTCPGTTSNDTWSELTEATASGFAMTAGSGYLYWIEVSGSDIEAAAAGKPFVALKVTENSNDPVVAGVVAVLLNSRYGGRVPKTAIA